MDGEEKAANSVEGRNPGTFDKEMSPLDFFYKQKELGSLPADEGVSSLQGAVGTGRGILRTAKDDDGLPLYADNPGSTAAICLVDEKKWPEHECLNIAFYVKDAYDDETLYLEVSSTTSGDKKTGDVEVTMERFTATQRGTDNDSYFKMAEDRSWSHAKSVVNKVLGWIESEFAACGIIDDPMAPISMIPMYSSGKSAIRADIDLQMRDFEGE